MKPTSSTWDKQILALVPEPCRGFFLNRDGLFDLEAYRETLGKVAKYLVPPHEFDYVGSLPPRRVLGVDVHDHPAVAPMFRSFSSWTTKQAGSSKHADSCLKALARTTKAMNKGRRCTRARKKRFARLMRDYAKMLRLVHRVRPITKNERELGRGVVYFLGCVKSHFYPR